MDWACASLLCDDGGGEAADWDELVIGSSSMMAPFALHASNCSLVSPLVLRKLVSLSRVPSRVTPRRLAPLRLVPLRSALQSLAPLRSASLRSAPLRDASGSHTCFRSALLR